jgi:hypothetical protein
MSDQPISKIRDCWAYNQQAQRCSQPAGHPGNHVISIEWSDEDCLDPMELLDATTRFMPVPAVATPPFDGVGSDVIMDQIARAEAAWENRDRAVDTEALAALAMDFGSPADPPVLVDNRCVACDHQHANGKCRCGCEGFIPRLA